jgi:hypothetical protein
MCGLRAKRGTSGVFGSSRRRTHALPRVMSVRPSFVRTGVSYRYVGPHPDERQKTRSGNYPKGGATTFPGNGMIGTASMRYTCRAFLLDRETLVASLKKSGKNRPTVDTVCCSVGCTSNTTGFLQACVSRTTPVCLSIGTSGRPCEGWTSRCRRCWYTVEARCCKETLCTGVFSARSG